MTAPDSCPSRINWLLIGAAFGLLAYPFYAVLLDLPSARKLRKG